MGLERHAEAGALLDNALTALEAAATASGWTPARRAAWLRAAELRAQAHEGLDQFESSASLRQRMQEIRTEGME